MKQPRTDILDQLEHARKMTLTTRARLRALEIQMAQRGSGTPPEILVEIETLAEHVKRYEKEMTQLETIAVEGELPVAEIEYRVLLAECWSTAQGWPTVLGAARLELARLRLGISAERAEQLEHDTRRARAKEVIMSVPDSFYTDYLQGFNHNLTNEFWTIGLAIRLQVDAAIEQFHSLLPPNLKAQAIPFDKQLLEVNQFWMYQPAYSLNFEQFVAALPTVLQISE